MTKLGFITFDEKLEAAWGLHKIEKAVLEKEIAELRAELKNENERVVRLFTQIEQLQKALDIAINASAAAIRESGE